MKYAFLLICLFPLFIGGGKTFAQPPAVLELAPDDTIRMQLTDNQLYAFDYDDAANDSREIVLKSNSKKIYNIATNNRVYLFQSNLSHNLYIIYPGEQIKVKGDKNGNAILYTDTNLIRNNELDFFRQVNIELGPDGTERRIRFIKKYGKNYDAVDSALNEMYKNKLSYLSEYSKKYPVTDSFLQLCREFFLYDYLAEKIRNANNVSAETRIKYRIDIDALIEQLNCDHCIDNLNYQMAINSYNYLLCSASIKTKQEFTALYDTATTRFKGITKEYRQFSLLYAYIENKDTAYTNRLNRFIETAGNKAYSNYLQSYYTRLNRQLPLTGNKNFIEDSHGKTITLEEVIAANRGNIIYVDFWASWCAPCREEMPASATLRAALTGKKIVFIYLSIDENGIAWKKANEDEGLGNYAGSFIFAKPKESPVVKAYKVKSIPRYMIIDQQGRIIQADATRPTNPETKKILLKLCGG
jgi:thiol-disulfide isomerase/thioredoxin